MCDTSKIGTVHGTSNLALLKVTTFTYKPTDTTMPWNKHIVRLKNAIRWLPLSTRCRFYTSSLGLSRLQRLRPEVINGQLEPVFIVGCGHSGTSLLCAVLDAHPKLAAIPHENYQFWRVPDPEFATNYFEKRFQEIAKTGCRPLEKTPRHIYVLDQLMRLYPKCRIIFMVRDPRAVAVSIKTRIGNLNSGIRRWNSSNKAAVPFLECPQIYTLKFEDFVAAPRNQLQEICGHLNIPYDHGLEAHTSVQRQWYGSDQKTAGAHSKRRFKQINTPIDSKLASKWMSQITAREVEKVDHDCAELMKYFRYPKAVDHVEY
ncbi:sulfotransferase family protein [Gimesia maris]|uniref:sulfotransferase family protein n=1 Tax=Gimesia maris TaxID=122 RepID=UPI003A90A02F